MEALHPDAYDQLHDLTEQIGIIKSEFVVRAISPNCTSEVLDGLNKTLGLYSDAVGITDKYMQRSLQARVRQQKVSAEDLVDAMRLLVEQVVKIRTETLGREE